MGDKDKAMTPSGVARRKGRKGLRRAKTLASTRLSRQEVEQTEEIIGELDHLRPRRRSDCVDGPRPCPWVSCRFHLYLDIHPESGSVKLNFPDLEVWEMPYTCALDVADQGENTLDDVGQILNLTRERIRQVEATGVGKLRIEYDDILGDDID